MDNPGSSNCHSPIATQPTRCSPANQASDASWTCDRGDSPSTGTENESQSRSSGFVSKLSILATWTASGLWDGLSPLKLHLGCGEQYFQGYINIDYPPTEHNVMRVKADFCINITQLELPEESIDEVRLHHVFKHFNRTTALAMLIRWQKWLKPGGILHIETPDVLGSAKTLLSDAPLKTKIAVARHLAGDQAASWAYHLDHWFPQRYEHTLVNLGFRKVQIKSSSWPHEPHLSNVEVKAEKDSRLSLDLLLRMADRLLWDSTVAACEKPTWKVWRQQLRSSIVNQSPETPCNIPSTATLTNKDLASGDSALTANPTPPRALDLYLGLKLYGHDAAIFAIIPETKQLFAMSQERLTRHKHDTLFPIDVIQRMIDYLGIDPSAIQNVYAASGFLCQRIETLPECSYEFTRSVRAFLGAPYVKGFQEALSRFQAKSKSEQQRLLNESALGQDLAFFAQFQANQVTLEEHFQQHLAQLFPKSNIALSFHDHELCHATSAYYPSGFERALVLAFDGYGDDQTFARVYLAESGELKLLGSCISPIRELRLNIAGRVVVHECSIGGIYSFFTELLGFTPNADEGKLEALAAYGNPENELFHALLATTLIDRQNGIVINHSATTSLLFHENISRILLTLGRENVAAAVQRFTEHCVLNYLRPFFQETEAKSICLSGGVMANVIVNLAIFNEFTTNVFVTPAMADDGCAQGAAIIELLKRNYTPETLRWLAQEPMPYFGSSYTSEEVIRRIQVYATANQMPVKIGNPVADWPERAAELIAQGKVGAVFHGRMEWGPRALGNRSILADARRPDIRDILNRDIKQRPSFQPFCPSMLDEEKDRLFENAYLNRHMTVAFQMKKEFQPQLPGAIHIDGTSRVEFVSESSNPNYHRLLLKMKELTGFGVVINTSFNKHGRTIVESPEDAVTDFFDSKLDFMFIEGCLVERTVSRAADKSQILKTIVFSKDRPAQLHATLSSFKSQCTDSERTEISVLYTTSNEITDRGYHDLFPLHPDVQFIKESDFKSDLLRALDGAGLVLFLVDDNLFTRPFTLRFLSDTLAANPTTLAISLRLGRNTTYCYSLDQPQYLPAFRSLQNSLLEYPWHNASCDFGYPLEVSSSIYRTANLLPLLCSLNYGNPNTLEAELARSTHLFEDSHPTLICPEVSVTFCAPINKVQTVALANRAGTQSKLCPQALALEWEQGLEIDVEPFRNFVPTACHQEVELTFKSRSSISTHRESTSIPSLPQLNSSPLVSIVVPCYNQASFLSEAIESVLHQSYTHWELIIVDDGSPDHTEMVALGIIAKNKHRNIRLIQQPNRGLASARNTGIRNTTGTYVLPLDADDKLHPDFLIKTISVLEHSPSVSIAYTDLEHFGAVEKVVHASEYDFSKLLNNNQLNYCSLYRR